LSATTMPVRDTATGALRPVFAAAGFSLAVVYAAIVSFTDDDPHAWRQFLVIAAIAVVVGVIAFAVARRLAGRPGDRPVARGALVLGVLAVLSLGAFWASIFPVLAAAATALAVETRDRRGGTWAGAPAVAAGLSAITVVLGAVAAVFG
jgi:hypothetical protein